MVHGKRFEGADELVARGGLEDDLPGVAAAGAFVESGGGRRKGEVRVLGEDTAGVLDFGEGGFLGFVGDGELGEVGKRGEVAAAALSQSVVGEGEEIAANGGLDGGVVGLVGLEDDAGGVEVAAPDAADDLGEKLEAAFFGREIGQGQPGVGLDDADGGEVGKIKPAREGLGADEEVDVAGFDSLVERGEIFTFFIIPVKTGELGFREKYSQLRLKQLRPEALVNHAGMVAVGAARGNLGAVATDMATESVAVGMESEREITIRAEGLPATFFTEGHGGRTTTIMKNQSLMVFLKIIGDFC